MKKPTTILLDQEILIYFRDRQIKFGAIINELLFNYIQSKESSIDEIKQKINDLEQEKKLLELKIQNYKKQKSQIINNEENKRLKELYEKEQAEKW